MAISTYTLLQSAVMKWLNRVGDAEVTAMLPDFISLVEARFNRTIWVPQSENSSTLTVSSATSALPADFRAVRGVYVAGSPNRTLEQVSPARLRELYPSTDTGTPQAYAIIDDILTFGPAPASSVSVVLDYYQVIPPLASNTANWLLTAFPDIYLYATLVQAQAYAHDPQDAIIWKSALEEALDELKEAGAKRRHNGPISPRLGPAQFRYSAT